MGEFQPAYLLVMQNQAPGIGTGDYGQVRAFERRAQITHGGRLTHTVTGRTVHRPEALLLIAVQIVRRRVSGLLRRGDERRAKRMIGAAPGHALRPGIPAIIVAALTGIRNG